MGFKPVGVDDTSSLFPNRVMLALVSLFATKQNDLGGQRIVRLTRAQYQGLTAAGRDANTLYIISDWP